MMIKNNNNIIMKKELSFFVIDITIPSSTKPSDKKKGSDLNLKRIDIHYNINQFACVKS